MAATYQWAEDNGTSTGSPAHGTTRSGFGADTHYPTDVNWKNIDDNTANSGTAYSSSPVSAGNNSFPKYQYGHFSGSFNQISAGLFYHTAGSLGTGFTLKIGVTSTYATPTTTAVAGFSTDATTAASIGSGLAVNFSTTGPEAASPTSTLSAAGYSQYLGSQMQTTGSAAPGDTASQTMTFQYNEN
jgi:hypothetical protein